MRIAIRLFLFVVFAVSTSDALAAPGSEAALPTGSDAELRSMPALPNDPRALGLVGDPVRIDALRRIAAGRFAFRFDTFGSEAFW